VFWLTYPSVQSRQSCSPQGHVLGIEDLEDIWPWFWFSCLLLWHWMLTRYVGLVYESPWDFHTRGVASNLFRRGTTSGVQSPGCGVCRQSPQKRENCAEHLIECKNSILFREKIFRVAISEGDMSPLSPLPCTPVSHSDWQEPRPLAWVLCLWPWNWQSNIRGVGLKQGSNHWVTLTFDLAFRWAFLWAKP